MDTPLKRMQMVLEMRGWSAGQWSLKAELERTNVQKIMKRIEETGEVSGDMKTFVKLADVAGVSLDWLLLGRGTPEIGGTQVADDPKYPTRSGAVIAARLLGFPEEVLQAVLAIDAGPLDPGADHWLQILMGKRAEFSLQHAPKLGNKP